MKPLNILLVEDDGLIAMLLTQMLEDRGHSICASAATEAEAIEAALAHKPELIISDSRLRVGDGVAAITEILRHQTVPYIFVSGDSAAILARFPQAIVLRKPFREEALVKAIAKVMAAAELT